MLHRCVFLVAVLYLVVCSRRQTPLAPQEVTTKQEDHLRIELRVGGGFTLTKQEWLAQVAEELARGIAPLPPTPVAQIPDLGPFHEERLAEEGIVEIVGIRIFVERLGEHHPQWELECLGRSRQVYRRSLDDPRTAIGVVFIAVERIGLDEQLFKSIFRYYLNRVLLIGENSYIGNMKQPSKRPRDTNQRAWQIVQETTRQTQSNTKDATEKKGRPTKPSKDQ